MLSNVCMTIKDTRAVMNPYRKRKSRCHLFPLHYSKSSEISKYIYVRIAWQLSLNQGSMSSFAFYIKPLHRQSFPDITYHYWEGHQMNQCDLALQQDKQDAVLTSNIYKT